MRWAKDIVEIVGAEKFHYCEKKANYKMEGVHEMIQLALVTSS